MGVKFATAALGLTLAALFGRFGEAAPGDQPQLAEYAKLIEAISQQTHTTVLFPNPQSIFDGYHLGFVNVAAGNLSFKRRDLVVRVSAASTLAFARVYDSRIKRNADFGPGWRLALAEELFVDGDGLIYVDRAGARHRFAAGDAGAYRANPPTPRHARTQVSVSPNRAAVKTADGTTRIFLPDTAARNRYVIATFTAANGDEVRFRYRQGRLSSVEANGDPLFDVGREASGRVAWVRDDLGRTVRYSYTASGKLQEVVDVGGNAWRHEYGRSGLTRAVGPNEQPYLMVRYRNGRVSESRGAKRHSFKYRQDRTETLDGAGVKRAFHQTPLGITRALASDARSAWALTLDDKNRVTRLRGGEDAYAFWYDVEGRLEKMRRSAPAGDEDWALAYAGGRLVRMVGPAGETNISYDGGRTEVWTLNTKREFLADARGVHQVRFEHVDGDVNIKRSASLVFNRHGDVAAILSGDWGVRFARNSLGQITKTKYGSWFESAYAYDDVGNRTSVHFGRGGSDRYAYDLAGNIQSVSARGTTGLIGEQSYRIGEMHRVTRVTDAKTGVSTTIDYDANGNPVAFESDVDAVRAHYDRRGRLTRLRSLRNGSVLAIDREMRRTGEADCVHERSPAIRQLLTRSALEAEQPDYGVVVFDEDSGAPHPMDPLAAYVPHYADASTLLDLVGAFFFDNQSTTVANFEKPSNPAFQPPEYRAVGCDPSSAVRFSPPHQPALPSAAWTSHWIWDYERFIRREAADAPRER